MIVCHSNVYSRNLCHTMLPVGSVTGWSVCCMCFPHALSVCCIPCVLYPAYCTPHGTYCIQYCLDMHQGPYLLCSAVVCQVLLYCSILHCAVSHCSLHIITVSVGLSCPLTLQPANPSRLPLLLHLDLWDAGADALAKYDYIKPAMLKDAAVALFCFSVTDRSSWEGLGDLVGGAGAPGGWGWGAWWVGLRDLLGCATDLVCCSVLLLLYS